MKITDDTVEKARIDAKVQAWLTELDAARKRMKEYRSAAAKTIKLYECGKSAESPLDRKSVV